MRFRVFYRINLQALPLIVGFGTSVVRPKQPFPINPNTSAIYKARPEHALIELIGEQGPPSSLWGHGQEGVLAQPSAEIWEYGKMLYLTDSMDVSLSELRAPARRQGFTDGWDSPWGCCFHWRQCPTNTARGSVSGGERGQEIVLWEEKGQGTPLSAWKGRPEKGRAG